MGDKNMEARFGDMISRISLCNEGEFSTHVLRAWVENYLSKVLDILGNSSEFIAEKAICEHIMLGSIEGISYIERYLNIDNIEMHLSNQIKSKGLKYSVAEAYLDFLFGKKNSNKININYNDPIEYAYISESIGNLAPDNYWDINVSASIIKLANTDDNNNRINVYNFTHSVFFGTNFGKKSLAQNVSLIATKVADILACNMIYQKEWDIALECILSILCLYNCNECENVLNKYINVEFPVLFEHGIISNGDLILEKDVNLFNGYDIFHTTSIFIAASSILKRCSCNLCSN